MIRKNLHRLLRWASTYNDDTPDARGTENAMVGGTDHSTARLRNIRLDLTCGVGGYIVETTVHPKNTGTKVYHDEEVNRTVYILCDGTDLSEEIGRIISLELMKTR